MARIPDFDPFDGRLTVTSKRRAHGSAYRRPRARRLTKRSYKTCSDAGHRGRHPEKDGLQPVVHTLGGSGGSPSLPRQVLLAAHSGDQLAIRPTSFAPSGSIVVPDKVRRSLCPSRSRATPI
jgi:hypothetical protein